MSARATNNRAFRGHRSSCASRARAQKSPRLRKNSGKSYRSRHLARLQVRSSKRWNFTLSPLCHTRASRKKQWFTERLTRGARRGEKAYIYSRAIGAPRQNRSPGYPWFFFFFSPARAHTSHTCESPGTRISLSRAGQKASARGPDRILLTARLGRRRKPRGEETEADVEM